MYESYTVASVGGYASYSWGDDVAVGALYSGDWAASGVYWSTSVLMLPSGGVVVSDGVSVTASKAVVVVSAAPDAVVAVDLAEM